MSLEGNVRFVMGAAIAAIAVIAVGSPNLAAIDSREKMRQEAAAQSAKAAKAFDAIMAVPDKAIPRDLLAKAKGIAVFPRVIKVAFTIGGEGGRGVVSKRIGDHWGPPVFLRAGGGSFGPQVGASATDALMQAAMLSYSRSRGVFAGLAIKGMVIKAEDDLNLAVYNKTAEELLTGSADTDPTADLEAFPRALNRYVAASSGQ